MAYRVRVLHSLLFGLAGFSLVLCSLFYTTPITSEPSTTTLLSTSDLSAATSLTTNVSSVAAASPTLEASFSYSGVSLNTSTSLKALSRAAGNKNVAADPSDRNASSSVAMAMPLLTDNKTTTDKISSDLLSIVHNGPNSPVQPEDVVPSQPLALVSTASAEQPNGPPTSNSVIQRIPPKSTVSKAPGNLAIRSAPVDTTSLGISTKSLYEAGHDIPNAELCPEFGKNLKVVILITSAPNHGDARMAIRQTWGHFGQRKDISIAFLLGATADSAVQRNIYSESEMYGDIIQSHFQDSYNNLTLKVVSLLEWVDTYCYQVKFILKTDDDMFINVPKLLTFIARHANDRRTIFGRLARKWKPMRNKQSKYYVSKEQYKYVLFPDFTTGPAYLMSSDIVHELYLKALEHTYLKLEDVYTTGIVAQEINVKRVHVNEFLNKKIEFHACHIQKAISIHMVKTSEQYDLWKKLLDGKTKCK